MVQTRQAFHRVLNICGKAMQHVERVVSQILGPIEPVPLCPFSLVNQVRVAHDDLLSLLADKSYNFSSLRPLGKPSTAGWMFAVAPTWLAIVRWVYSCFSIQMRSPAILHRLLSSFENSWP